MSLVYAPVMSPGAALAALRASRHMTQEELVKLSGLGRRTIQRLENGENARPRRASLVGLARAFGLTVDQLKHDLGLAPFGSQRPETPTNKQAESSRFPYGPRLDRIALMFLNLSSAQQDYVESVILNLHSARYQPDPRDIEKDANK